MRFDAASIAGLALIGAGAFMLWRMRAGASSATETGEYRVRADPFAGGGGGGILQSLLSGSGGDAGFNPQSIFEPAAPAAPDPAPSSAAAPADPLRYYSNGEPIYERNGDE